MYTRYTLKEDIYGEIRSIYTIAVTLAVRSHLFSYRTQKLSSPAPTILDWRRSGKIGSCCIQNKRLNLLGWVFHFVDVSNYRSRPDNRADCVREEVAPALSLAGVYHFLNIMRVVRTDNYATYLLSQMNGSCCG